MGRKSEDKICPKCGNSDEDFIEESFSHLDEYFFFEYYCKKCKTFYSRVFEYSGVYIRSEEERNKLIGMSDK